MITKKQVENGRQEALLLLQKANIKFTEEEMRGIEVADFGLGNYPTEGAQIMTFLNTQKVGFKIICLFENQILPEHMHTASLGETGKEETFRGVYGNTHLFLPGDNEKNCPYPEGKGEFYTCRREKIIRPLDQITLEPDTPHWLMGGVGGCVVYSISSWARCALDPFTDPKVIRETVVID